MTKHHKVIHCNCGKTFESEEKFELHKEMKKRKAFEEKAQEWYETHTGGDIVSWHDSLMKGMGSITAYDTAKRNDDLSTKPTDENVRDACIEWLKESLQPQNAEQMFWDEFHEE